MPSFEYKAIKPDGSEVTEVMEAKDADAVTRYLDKLGYLPLKIKQSGGGVNLKLFSNRRKLKDVEVVMFTRQLVTLLRAGVPLLSCLDALVEQADSEGLKEIIEKIYVDIESGLSLSDAIKQHPKEFSELYINSIKAGEMGGSLDKVLERLVELMEHEQEVNARIKSAMRYPIIVVVTLVLAFVALMMLVVPNFIDLFTKMKIELPLPTRLLIGFHYVLSNYWYLVIAGLSAIAFGFFKYIKTEKGAFRWDQFMITVPIFGDLNLKTAMSRFTRMFETLNSSGLPILQTLEITSKTVGNIVIGKEIEKAAAGVLQGAGLAGPLAEGKIFPPMVIRMISIGEQSGSLDTMLLNVSKHYDTEVEYAVKNLTGMIEPVLTVGVGVIVLFLALAIFLPMWSLTTLAK
ncbi:type II secretion system F family protein [candidate division KSB1 bacterium]|nr:type II secretion system F family protein [candidate division KSB1 bacterium]